MHIIHSKNVQTLATTATCLATTTAFATSAFATSEHFVIIIWYWL